MSTNQHEKIIEIMLTEDDRREVLYLLDSLSDSIFNNSKSPQEVLMGSVRFGQALSMSLPPNIESQSKEDVENKIEELRTTIKGLKKIVVILAIMPTEKILSSLRVFGASTFPEKVVFDLSINPDIIGGAIFIIDGIYRDYSLLKKLNEAAQKKREALETLIPR